MISKRRDGEVTASVPLGNHNWNVTPDIQLSIGVCCGYLNARVSETLLQWLAKDGMLGLARG